MMLEVVMFHLNDRPWGLPTSRVIEFSRAVAIRPLPGAPAMVEGVINVRGEILAVFDIRSRFGLEARPLSPTDHFILARASGRKIVLRVDRVLEVLTIPDDALSDASGILPGVDCITAIAMLDDDLLLVQDLDAFLDSRDEIALDQALAALPRGGD